ncbi:MAG TPA: ATP-dependent 6-phosphofructokinase [Candidatus Saccharimonadales bacterium]|nr:ATP-dependent 6-phosphofructokinase [Candidatus Saccharimonadales bacterium]
MKIGILNGGGDCAGLNAVTRAVVRQCEQFGFEIIGIRHGWAGLIDIDTVPLNWKTVSHVIKDGGTILHTTRTNPFSRPQGPETVLKNVKKLGLDTLIAVGGEDTLSVCAKLSQMGLRSIGVPKTIDNDVYATDVTFGFDSAVNVTVEAIDRIETTAESHDRIMIVEVMGRDAGWIAAYAGIASGANLTLVPEEPFDLDEISNFLRNRHQSGATMSIVIVGEGCRLKGLSSNQNSAMVDEFGHPRLGGIGELLAKELEKRVGIETRVVVLGHLVRGGRPSAYDRILATRLGAAAVQAVKDEEFNVMVCLHNNKLTRIPITEILGRIKKLDEGTLSLVKDFTI